MFYRQPLVLENPAERAARFRTPISQQFSTPLGTAGPKALLSIVNPKASNRLEILVEAVVSSNTSYPLLLSSDQVVALRLSEYRDVDNQPEFLRLNCLGAAGPSDLLFMKRFQDVEVTLYSHGMVGQSLGTGSGPYWVQAKTLLLPVYAPFTPTLVSYTVVDAQDAISWLRVLELGDADAKPTIRVKSTDWVVGEVPYDTAAVGAPAISSFGVRLIPTAQRVLVTMV